MFVQDDERLTGYTFRLVDEDTYWCRDTQTMRKCWLGLKLHMPTHPHKGDGAACWWFDDRGKCTDTVGDFKFLLTRKRLNRLSP